MRVHPDVWRRGFGSAMLERLEARARDLGCRTLELCTTARQRAARRFYESRGYVETDRFPSMGFEVIRYEKELRGA
jgi:GNAT superfamily N-acetyltransferase